MIITNNVHELSGANRFIQLNKRIAGWFRKRTLSANFGIVIATANGSPKVTQENSC